MHFPTTALKTIMLDAMSKFLTDLSLSPITSIDFKWNDSSRSENSRAKKS